MLNIHCSLFLNKLIIVDGAMMILVVCGRRKRLHQIM